MYGRLETDRPHQLKLNGTYIAPFGTAFGAYQYIGSGTPISRQVNVQTSTPMFYLGRASDGRMSTFTQTDVYLSHSFRLGGNRAIRLEANVENLFDEDNTTGVFKLETRTALPLTDARGLQRLRRPAGDRFARHPARPALPAAGRLPGAPRHPLRRALPVLRRDIAGPVGNTPIGPELYLER